MRQALPTCHLTTSNLTLSQPGVVHVHGLPCHRATSAGPACSLQLYYCNYPHIQSGVCNFTCLTVIGGSIKFKSGLTGSTTSSRSLKLSPLKTKAIFDGHSFSAHRETSGHAVIALLDRNNSCNVSKTTSVLAPPVVFLWNAVCWMFTARIYVPLALKLSWTMCSWVFFSTEPTASIIRDAWFSVVLEEKNGRFGLVACRPQALKWYQTRLWDIDAILEQTGTCYFILISSGSSRV